MATSESSAPSGAHQSLQEALQDLSTLSVLIGHHAAHGMEEDYASLTRETWWRQVDVLDWLSRRLKETVQAAWRCYDVRPQTRDVEQPASALRDLERQFAENEARWRAIASGSEDEPFSGDEEQRVLDCMERCVTLLKEMSEQPTASLDDAVLKMRVALRRLHDGDKPPRVANVGPPDDLHAYALLAQARDFLERFAAA